MKLKFVISLLLTFSSGITVLRFCQEKLVNEDNTSSSVLTWFDTDDHVHYRRKIENRDQRQVNINVLVYTIAYKNFKDGLRDLMFEGNYRHECNLPFDCIFQQIRNHDVTADMFYSMDAVIVGDEATNFLRDDIKRFNGTVTLETRKRDQIWIAYSEESSKNKFSRQQFQLDPILNKMFNWTIFQSKNATIHKKFFNIYEKNEDESYSEPQKDFASRNKSKDFCWMISNCINSFPQTRFKIANSLIRSLSSKVHIWGNAMKRGCVKRHRNIHDHGPVDGLHTNYYDIAQKHIKDCKFYFAFENSNCSDYVTEKFFNSISVGAIPIVVGWWDTYKELLPGSFIHVNEFASVPLLANYLDTLVKDEEKLNKYHEWRKFYKYERSGAEAACELCQKLQNVKTAQLSGEQINPSIVTNMAEQFQTLQKCST